MEKIQLNKCLSAMANGTPSKVVGVNNGAGVLATPAEISDLAGCGTIPETVLYSGKWYRIAIGAYCNFPSSAILTISKKQASSSPTSQLFFINSDGFSGSQNILNIFSSRKSISKIRTLFKKDVNAKSLIDIYIDFSIYSEPYIFSYACNVGFKFQTPIEVASTPDEGYSVKEFVF